MVNIKRHAVIVLLTGLLAISGVARLAAWVSAYPVTPLDQPVSQWIQSTFSPSAALMDTISLLGYTPISQMFIVTAAVCWWVMGLRRTAFVTLLILPNGLISLVSKLLVNRPRPTDELVTVARHLDDSSFPSGHVIIYTAVFGFFIFAMLMNSRLQPALRAAVVIISLFMLLTVGISRVYLGAHWITDVMGGYLIGLSILSLAIFIYCSHRIAPRLVDS